MAEPIREIETDVLVVGVGTAGFLVARSELCVRLIAAWSWPPVPDFPGARAIRRASALAVYLPN